MAQFNSLLVTGNSRFLNPINGNARNGVYQVIGTQTAATGAWTGNIPVPALYDGLTIIYYLPYAGSGSATLNLTLSDGTTTGAINCYYRKTERLTTHYPSGSSIVLTYHPAGSIKYDGTATTDNRWVANANYLDGNDTAYYDRIVYVRATAGSNKVFPYTLVMRLPDGRWESLVTSSSTGTGKARNTHGFLFGQLDWMNYNETYNENALIGEYRLWSRYTNLVDYRYSFNLTSSAGFTANKPVYLVGSISSDGLFYLDATWWTQTLPSSADGKIYLYIGDAYDWYRASFYGTGNFRAYVYTNGHVREYNQDAGTVNGHTVAKDVPSNAIFTDNNTTYTLSTSGNNVVLTPSSGSANTITVPYATNAGTVNGHTVAKDVPSNAVFTDNNTTYTFANGTNGFTVTPSGGSAQTVTVTPSISNNVTGSGTSGYLTKFNGANTITNGPALGSDTTKFLRNDGTWASPAAGSDVNVTQTATSTSANYEVLFSGTADNTTRTEGARKNNNLTFNPSTGNLQATQLNGVNVGNSPAFTDTKVMQTGDNATNADFPILFAGTADATTRTEGTKKSARIVYNPYSSFLRFKASNGISYTDISTGQIALSATDGETGELNIHTLITPDVITLGNHDSEDPNLVLYATSEGGVVIAHQIVCNTILVSDISEDYIPSKTSGNWSIGSDDGIYRIKAYRMGNLVQMSIAFHGNGSAVSSGSNGFVGNISGGPLPTQQVTLTGFYSSSILAATLDTDGSLTVRPFSASCTLSNASRAYLTGTFMFE